MTLPVGITTATVTFGKALGIRGTAATMSASVEVDRGLVWSATGDSIYTYPEPIDGDDTGISFDVPHVDQAGFVDSAGDVVTDWAYTLTAQVVFANKSYTVTKSFQVFEGQTSVDLDLVPTGTITEGVTAPSAAVLSVAGETGHIAIGDLASLLAVTTDITGAIDARVPTASTTAQGKVELATNGEVTTGTDSARAVTPAGVKTVLDPIRDLSDPTFAANLSASTVQLALPRNLIPTHLTDVDVDEAIAIFGQDQVGITTYVGGTNAIVHPSLLFFDEGWNGWRYWMAYTPYNSGDFIYENPSIAVSNDGVTWSTPVGLTNPVEAALPVGTGYNADPCLCMSADGQTMLMVWKRSDTSRKTCLRTSTDGVTWTARQVLFDNAFEDVAPALLWDNGLYKMWTVKPSDTPNTLYLRTATDPEGPWSAPVACTGSLPSSEELWHMDIKRVGQQYHMVMQSELGSGLGGGLLYFGKSNDGLAWTFSKQNIMQTMTNPQNSFYKVGLLPKITPDGLAYDMWYSSATTYLLFKTTITFDRSKRTRDINNDILAAKALLTPWVFCDDFTRADTTAGLGTSTSGHAWSKTLGNDMGISSNQAYLPTAANSRWIVDPGVADLRLSADFKTKGTSGWLIFRYQDASNLWRVGHSGGIVQLQKIIAGSLTTVKTTSCFIRDGDRLGVMAKGTEIRLYLNGLEFYRTTDSALSTATKIGINVDNIAARFDNMIARSA